ncbi:MAG TPA: thioesterase domain-containing protein [Rhodocyclaceae bacterium]|nr:thioesterase domain-containing protein [Rhodocyclaceae bacterium]
MILDDDKRWFPFGFGNVLAPVRLFCLPFAGGGASFFMPWRKSLPDVAVVPVQYPGRETRMNEPCFQELGHLVDGLAWAIMHRLDRPYAILGYSLGAKAGFAVVHRLIALGAPAPNLFIAAAHGAPDAKPVHPGAHHLPDSEFNEHIRRYGGMPEIVFQDPDLARLLLPVLRADIALVEHTVPTQPLPCPILAYGGSQDAAATATMMDEWKRFADDRFAMRSFHGGHFFARTDSEFLPTLARDLAQAMHY